MKIINNLGNLPLPIKILVSPVILISASIYGLVTAGITGVSEYKRAHKDFFPKDNFNNDKH